MSVPIPAHLLNEIEPNRNGVLEERNIYATTVLWWKCDKGHEWDMTLYQRMHGANCPICANRRVLKGFNDLATVAPAIAEEWHPTKNVNKDGLIISASDVVYGKKLTVWWLCSQGHEWETDIGNRVRSNSGCPYCSGLFVIEGVTDLATLNPDVAKEWHPTKNGDLLPTQVALKSGKRVWWLGACGHEWDAVINKRTVMGRSCPFCTGQKVLKGFNDLATTHPDVAKEWHPTKNGDLKPEDFVGGRNLKFWWVCDKGHEWETTIAARKSGAGCHYCTGQKVLQGFNDLDSLKNSLAKEWHPTKNGNLKPTEISFGSNQKVWWLGACGHEWEAFVRERSGTHNTGCPKCPTVISKAETEIGSFVSNLLPNLTVEYGVKNLINKTELDIYIPEKKIAIEYNGLYWHSEKFRSDPNYHYDKFVACKNKDIRLIQIWEHEWRDSPDIVKSMLASKLGVSKNGKVYARNTAIRKLTPIEANQFLNKHHIQGEVNGRIRLGLIFDNQIVAVMILKNESSTKGEVLNLLRYATSVQVVGGFTKMLSSVHKLYPEVKKVVTFSDNLISEGKLYSENGFTQAGIIKPDYQYRYKNSLSHKFNFRLKNFKNNPDLKFEEGLTEKELAELNNLLRVWDAGKVKWEYVF